MFERYKKMQPGKGTVHTFRVLGRICFSVSLSLDVFRWASDQTSNTTSNERSFLPVTRPIFRAPVSDFLTSSALSFSYQQTVEIIKEWQGQRLRRYQNDRPINQIWNEKLRMSLTDSWNSWFFFGSVSHRLGWKVNPETAKSSNDKNSRMSFSPPWAALNWIFKEN